MNEVRTRTHTRKMQEMHKAMLAEGKPAECPVRHFFQRGKYMREMLIPAGTTILGKIHRHGHLNNISVGHVLVYTEEGVQEFKAPHAFVSTPGTQRLVYALEDTVWTTYHENPSDTRDLAQLEAEIIAPSYAALTGEPDDMGISCSGGSEPSIGYDVRERCEQEG